MFSLVALLLLLSGCAETQVQGGTENCGGGTCISGPQPRDQNSGEPRISIEPPLWEIEGETSRQEPEISLSVSTGKGTYGSSEEVEITVLVVSSVQAEDAVISVWGITPYSKNYIENQKTVGLEEGSNTVVFSEKTPRCTSGCGGVKPGAYTMHASVSLGGTVIAEAETEITLVSG